MGKKFLENIWQYVFTALIGLSLYFILFLPLEYYLTEIRLSVVKLDPLVNTGVLFLFLLIANLLNYKKILTGKGKIIILTLFISFSFIYYGYYHQIKASREHLPKIISVYPASFIQAQLIEINGINFGSVTYKGKVIINEKEFVAKEWNDGKIIIEAPVSDNFGIYSLSVKTKDGEISNQIQVEILDPVYLLNN